MSAAFVEFYIREQFSAVVVVQMADDIPGEAMALPVAVVGDSLSLIVEQRCDCCC